MQRYNDLSSYLKEKFGSRLLKLSIDGGFSCPNRKTEKRM
ncbi:conserved domain protein [Parvimonas sp. oral taxon 393 str. F0440]|nr:conserved domain protein [Parvimonas sp. oral taxon 393 str. F0440]